MKENKEANTYLKSYKRQKFTKYAMILGVSMAMATIATPLVETTQVQAATLSTAQEGFLASLTKPATQLAGDNDLYASVMLAQAILESGWGTSELAVKNYNLFGIKGSYNGETANMPTLEDDGTGNMYEIVAGFKKYPSYAESLQDYVNLIKNGTSWDSEIYAGAWMENTTSYADATKALTGVYATDTAYNTKLDRIIVSNDLNQYDNYGAGSPDPIIEDIPVTNPTDPVITTPTVPKAPSSTPTATATATSYTVIKGDTLWKVSNNYGVPVSELKTLNNLTSDTIYVGQVLKLALPTVNTTPTVTSPTVTAPTTSTATAYNTYTVVKGDTLWGVATKNNVTVASLKTLNNLTSDTILVGQVLNISVKAATSTNTTTTTPVQTETSTKSYTVVSGDTLWGVATKNNISVATLKTLNNLTSDVIYVGQILKISTTTSAIKPSATPEAVSTVITNKTYTVISGDTLWGVATKNGLTVSKLKELNKLTSDVIFPGQVLIVGTTTTSSNTTTVAPSTSTSTISTTTPVATKVTSYTVQKGDTLYKVALENNLSIANLKSYNNLTSDTIYVGQVLSLVNATPTVTAPTTNTNTTAPTTTTNTTADGSYVVKSGDTLWGIATSKGLTVTELKTLNGLSSDVIVVGQTLKVTGTIVTKEPTPVVTPTPEPTQTTTPTVTSGGTYTVVSGDTLYKIAVANGLTVTNLKAYNGLTSDIIIVGQTLKLSGTTTSTGTVTTPPIPTTSQELSASFIVPASGYISSPFGSRLNPFTNLPEFHYGVDLAGSGAIKAAQSGKVVTSGWHNSYGNYVIIDHGTINGKNVKTVYAHLAVRYVVVGDYVTQGQQIAVMGTTGDSTGVHLHFEVRENDYVVEPLNYIPLSYGSTSTGTTTNSNTYTVKSGDTLWGISSKNGVSLASLLELNDLTSSEIYVGQTLTLR